MEDFMPRMAVIDTSDMVTQDEDPYSRGQPQRPGYRSQGGGRGGMGRGSRKFDNQEPQSSYGSGTRYG